MTRQSRCYFFATCILLSGASVALPVRVIPPNCGHDSVAAESLVPFEAEGISLRLPVGSKLASFNTEDARYWVWHTPSGDLSVTWVGKFARRPGLARLPAPKCRVNSGDGGFTLGGTIGGMTAVSEALHGHDGGLIVEFLATGAAFDRDTAIEILRSLDDLEYAPTSRALQR